LNQAPATATQLLLLVIFVLPGVVYQMVRERWRGTVPGEVNIGERVLRAIVSSLVLDVFYLIVAGPELVQLVAGYPEGTSGGILRGISQHPRVAGLVAAVLFLAVPSLTAFAVSSWKQRHLPAKVLITPTAWNHAFRKRTSCYVRARLKDGSWVGGWYGNNSYATGYPQPPELLVETAWRMNSDGSFREKCEQITGLYINGDNIDVLEFLERPQTSDTTNERAK